MFFFSQLLGRNVYPVSMLSYIPETSAPHHRVKTIRKVEGDLMESSESQEESDSPSKPRKSKVKKAFNARFCLFVSVNLDNLRQNKSFYGRNTFSDLHVNRGNQR